MSDDVLELSSRREIFELVNTYPGLHMRELCRRLDMSVGLMEYHLTYLENAEIITSITEGGYRRYYLHPDHDGSSQSALGHPERRMLGLLRQEYPLRIILYLLSNGQATLTDMASHLGISPSKLSYHIKKLTKAGLARKLDRREGRGYAVEDGERIRRLLVMHKPPQDMMDEFSELWEDLDIW